MLVATDHQAIILPNVDIASMLTFIPTAKVLQFQGQDLLVVPHQLDETRVLRNMGYEAPSPIGFYYDWPKLKGIFDPFDHQRETAAFNTLYKRCYVLNDIGTGKTNSALWAADYLMMLGLVRKVLILSPLSCLERVWGDAIFETLPNRTFTVLHGAAARRKTKLAKDYDFYIVNHDGVEVINEVRRDPKKGTVLASTFTRDDFDLIIIDELAVYRNAQTDKYRVLKKAIKPEHWIWGMTGAPNPEGPTDTWAQCRLVTPETVPEYFTTFRNMTMTKLTQYRWVPRPEATEICYKAMQPAIRFTRDQCLDLPELMPPTELGCELSSEQKTHYKEIMQELYTEVQGKGIKAVNEGVKRIKLLQVICGVLYADQFDELGKKLKGRATLEIDHASRMTALRGAIEACGEKVIVFAPFSAVLDMLLRELSKDWSCALVYGDTPKGQRDQIFADFQQRPDPHVLIADAGTMSHGLTLTEASTCIWYAPIDSNEDYTQANGRITRQGQKNVQNIIHLSSTPVERRIYKRLETKQKVEGAILEMVEQGMLD